MASTRSTIASVADGLSALYGEAPVHPPDAFADYGVLIAPGAGLRRWLRARRPARRTLPPAPPEVE